MTTKILIQYAIVAALISFGIFTLINYDVSLIEWTDTSKFGWVLLTAFIYHNTTKQHRDE
jgi:hypothetical protein